jgi:diguanylate cyclase (GGDEF)-like protein
MAFEADDTAARLQAEFPRALREGQVAGHFQPEVELLTGRLVAAELLARWEHPELGTLQPALFTTVAEEVGLMREFSLVMLRQALVQHRAWADAGWVVPVAVNIGPSCVTDPDFPAAVAQLLREEHVPGQMLTLEVSEETGTAAASTRFFAELAEFQVQVSLDDFGTGYASLESLGGWPINELKLDRSIVRPIISSASFRTIVRTTIDLAHQLGVKMVAEGVESAAIGSELRALGCDIGQGFYLGRPMPAAAFTEWMRDPVRSALRLAPSGYPQARPAAIRADSGGIAGRTAGRARRGLRRIAEPVGAGTLTAALVMLAVYGLWQVFRWGGKQHQAMIGDLSLLPVNIAVVTLSWRVSRRQDLGRQSRRSWRCLTAALTLYMLGDVLQFVYEVVLHERAYPTWADAAYLSFYVVASFSLLSTPRSQRRSGSERARRLLDMGTVFAGGAVLIWYVALGPALAWGAHFDLIDLVTYAYPVGDLLLLFGILSVLWRGVPPSAVLSLRIFAGGILLFIAADVTYDYITVHSTYLGGDPVDTLWLVALTAISLSAAARLRTKPTGFPIPPPVTAPARPSSLPYFAIVSSYLLLVVVGLRSVKFDPLGGILVGALVLTFMVSTRQYLALRDNGRLAARYRELATVDGITGVYNRRHFMEAAEAAFAHAQRTGKPFAALMIDVDKFKQINDTYGHSAGDRVLAELAQLCREHTRPDDIVGRYGGDEFIIMVTGITTLRAVQLADQLIRPSGRALGGDGTPPAYTVSIGIAECPPDADLSLLLMHADLAMYEAKQAGGGGWRIFGDGDGTEEADIRPATVPDALPDGTQARH